MGRREGRGGWAKPDTAEINLWLRGRGGAGWTWVNQDGTLALARSFGPSASMAAGFAARCSSSATSIATKLVQSTPDIVGVEVGGCGGVCGRQSGVSQNVNKIRRA